MPVPQKRRLDGDGFSTSSTYKSSQSRSSRSQSRTGSSLGQSRAGSSLGQSRAGSSLGQSRTGSSLGQSRSQSRSLRFGRSPKADIIERAYSTSPPVYNATSPPVYNATYTPVHNVIRPPVHHAAYVDRGNNNRLTAQPGNNNKLVPPVSLYMCTCVVAVTSAHNYTDTLLPA